MNKITTLDIEIAMMKQIGIRQNIVVPNASWGVCPGLHECDLLSLSKSGFATEIEIKVSKADLLKDAKKTHGHEHNYIKYLSFAVPEKLKEIALNNIPSRSGLYTISKNFTRYDLYPNPEKIPFNRMWYNVKLIKLPEARENAHKWTYKEIMNLSRLGTLRILGLKTKISKLKHNERFQCETVK